MKQRLIAWLMCAAVLFGVTSRALAGGGAPASQFYFGGWPYRESGCGACDIGCGQCQSNADCPACELCCAVTCTAAPAPTQTPTATGAPTQTPPAAATNVPSTAPATPIPVATAAQPAARPTAAATTTPNYTMVSLSAQEESAWNLLNEDRVANGLDPLPLDAELSRLARMKSTDMFENNYFAHTSPTYGSASQMLAGAGYAFVSVSENIAHHATVLKAQAAFMSSSGHRQNILGSQWTKVGVGVCYDENGFVYVTQLFVR